MPDWKWMRPDFPKLRFFYARPLREMGLAPSQTSPTTSGKDGSKHQLSDAGSTKETSREPSKS